MPLSDYQKDVALLIASNRRPESHIAGGAAINRDQSALRFSEDLDIFHDRVADLAIFANADEQTLLQASYHIEWVGRESALYQAIVTKDEKSLRLDWSVDSAFRFFPIQPDEEFGYCLHKADLATNKLLALAGRLVIRDFLDVLQLHRTYLSLGTMAWAACGKDPGFSPDNFCNGRIVTLAIKQINWILQIWPVK